MTRNYLTYMSNLEIERSNKAHEKETNRHNLVTEQETNRHNVATEMETNRHNLVIEEQGWQSLAESARHNYAVESIQGGQLELGYSQLEESSRHNRVYEVIQTIGARASESQAVASQIQAQAASLNAETNQQNADTRYAEHILDVQNYTESKRHNIATEAYNESRLELEGIDTRAEAFRDITSGAKNIASTLGDALQLISALRLAH